MNALSFLLVILCVITRSFGMSETKRKSRPVTEITGKTFHRWTAIKLVGRDKWGNATWLFRCCCGTECVKRADGIIRGGSKSCGCLASEVTSANRFKHGESRPFTPEYRTWASIHRRCNNPNSTHYARYGGRGISVCERWSDFRLFLADMGRRPTDRHSIDRFPNNDGNYEPGNVRWATPKEQSSNTSRSRVVSLNGVTGSIENHAAACGKSYDAMWMWLKRRGLI